MNYKLILVGLVFSTFLKASGDTQMETFDSLPPGEQYRQLSLVLLISGDANPGLVDTLLPFTRDSAQSKFDPDDYKTPLARIVDQQSMLAGAVFLLQFARDSHAEILSKLASLIRDNPVLISMLDVHAMTEDAIIIRNAIADSISYANTSENPSLTAQVLGYRTQTIHLRNMLEYELFSAELKKITHEAILTLGGKLDAYQRMFDEEVDTKEHTRNFDAAQFIFNRSEKFDEHAGKLTEEIMRSVILSQSQPDS